MAIMLGKDCSISLDSGEITSARNVTFTESARTIEINEFGSRYSAIYSTGYDCSVSVEFNDADDFGSAFSRLHTGTAFNVSGSGFGFQAIVVGITRSEPIDGVVTCTIEAKLTHPSLRSGNA